MKLETVKSFYAYINPDSERDLCTTSELASKLKVAPQTIHKHHCLNGEYFGLRPRKLPNGRLLWSCAELNALLTGGVR